MLISSLKYNAIHLDRVSIILIRNLAAADLGFGLCLVVVFLDPTMEGYDIQHHACVTFSFLSALFMGAGSNFLAGLNINKVSVLIFPLRASVRRFKRGYIISGVVWALTTTLTVASFTYLNLSAGKFPVEYNEYTFRCDTINLDKDIFMSLAAMFTQICFTFIPLVCVMVTTIWMGCFVRKVFGIQRQTIFTLLVVSVTLIFSLTPAIVFFVMSAVLGTQEIKTKECYRTLQIVFPLMVSINCAANPFIYCVTVRSFGAFVEMKLKSARNELRRFVLRARQRQRIRVADLAARVIRVTSTRV